MDPDIESVLDAASQQELSALLRREDELAGELPPTSDIHPAARKIAGALQADKPDRDWGSVRCNRDDLLFVRVSPTGITRAVTLADAIYRMADQRGWRWQKRSSDWSGGAVLEVAGQPFQLRIEETSRRVPHKITPEERAARERRARSSSWDFHLPLMPRWDFLPTNDFVIREGSRQLMKDRAKAPIEGRLPELPRRLVERAFSERARALKWAAREAELTRLRVRQQRRTELRELRSGLTGRLLKLSGAWEDAERLRRFISAAEGAANGVSDDALQRWLAEARSVADRLDPLTRLTSIVEAEQAALEELAELGFDDEAIPMWSAISPPNQS